MSLAQRLRQNAIGTQRTLLGVGPMSQTCVAATAELAAEYNVPLMLIASRRQIDCAAFGGGYVENWTTEAFAETVKQAAPDGRLILCRDHGGPWQGNNEASFSADEAMARAKQSYAADIASGFGVIHIDPSLSPSGEPDHATIMKRVYELLGFCWEEAQKRGADIVFEIGTEEQHAEVGNPEELAQTLDDVATFCTTNGIPMPVFMVAQTGTKVLEMENVGLFEKLLNMPHGAAHTTTITGALPPHAKIPAIVELFNQRGIMFKQHNTDYLSNHALQQVTRLGVHAANVAPEFGVAETKTIVHTLRSNGMADVAETFVALANASGKWGKWLKAGTHATAEDKATICGHYIFATPEGRALLAEATRTLAAKGVDLPALRHHAVKAGIARYIENFGWPRR